MKDKAYLKAGMLPPKEVKRRELAQMLIDARKRDGRPSRLRFKDARGYQFRETPFNPYTYLIAL